MIDEIASWVRSSAEGVVSEASFDGFNLSITGSNWGFSTTSPWRLVRDGDLVAGCGDENVAAGPLAELIGGSLVQVEPQSGLMKGDPVLVFSTGTTLEVFADTHIDPWTFVTPRLTYVGTPGDSRYNR